MNLSDKVALVTGGSRGIGRAIAIRLAEEGANVALCARNVEAAESVEAEVKDMGRKCCVFKADDSDSQQADSMIKSVIEELGSLYAVVNNAGITRDNLLLRMKDDEWDAVIAVHLKGHFTVYRHAMAIMRKQESGGSILGITSGAFTASTAQPNYSAAKGGIVSLTRSAAMAAASISLRGGPVINANCLAPTARTRMSENVPFAFETGDPEDVAPMAIYLLSDQGRDVNAQIYSVVGRRISVWNQPREIRTMYSPDEAWTPEEIASMLPNTIKQEPNPFIDDLERRMKEMEAGDKSGD